MTCGCEIGTEPIQRGIRSTSHPSHEGRSPNHLPESLSRLTIANQPESRKETKMNNEEEEVIQIIFNWINLGYRRESCVKMTIAQGYSKKFAIKVVDEAFERLCELYNDLA